MGRTATSLAHDFEESPVVVVVGGGGGVGVVGGRVGVGVVPTAPPGEDLVARLSAQSHDVAPDFETSEEFKGDCYFNL